MSIFTPSDYMALPADERPAVDAWLAEHWLFRDRILQLRFTDDGRVVATEESPDINGRPRINRRTGHLRTVERGARIVRPFRWASAR